MVNSFYSGFWAAINSLDAACRGKRMVFPIDILFQDAPDGATIVDLIAYIHDADEGGVISVSREGDSLVLVDEQWEE